MALIAAVAPERATKRARILVESDAYGRAHVYAFVTDDVAGPVPDDAELIEIPVASAALELRTGEVDVVTLRCLAPRSDVRAFTDEGSVVHLHGEGIFPSLEMALDGESSGDVASVSWELVADGSPPKITVLRRDV